MVLTPTLHHVGPTQQLQFRTVYALSCRTAQERDEGDKQICEIKRSDGVTVG